MPTENVTNEPSSVTGSGLKDTVLNGLKALFRRSGTKSPVETFTIEQIAYGYGLDDNDEIEKGWYIVSANEPYAGPYKREKDAKGQLTRLRKGYTPAARKV